MKVWGAIFNVVAVLIIMILFVVYSNMSTVIQRDFDQVRLNYAVEYATEGMFQTTLKSEDLDIDYTDIENVKIDSSDALNVFCSMLCLSYDMALSDENFENIENSISAIALAGTDGFYIGKMSDNDASFGDGILVDSKKLRWSVKIPYFISDENYTYAVSFGSDDWSRISCTTSDSSISGVNIHVSANEGLPMGISEEDVQHAVNNQVRNALLAEINHRNYNQEAFDYKFYLPDTTTVNHVNPIEPPSILLVMRGIDFASSEKINALSVAGFKVTQRVNVIAFVDTVTNKSYYCYESQLRDEERDACCGGTGRFHIENYYKDIKDAASDISPTTGEHYYPYYDVMTRKITKE